MKTCAICGKEAESLPFTIFYNDTEKVWDVGSHVCEDCVKQVLTQELTVKEEDEVKINFPQR